MRTKPRKTPRKANGKSRRTAKPARRKPEPRAAAAEPAPVAKKARPEREPPCPPLGSHLRKLTLKQAKAAGQGELFGPINARDPQEDRIRAALKRAERMKAQPGVVLRGDE
jgi:hypothetical protein